MKAGSIIFFFCSCVMAIMTACPVAFGQTERILFSHSDSSLGLKIAQYGSHYIFEVTSEVEFDYEVFSLKDPARVVIDIISGQIDRPLRADLEENALFAGIRTGIHPDKVRIVLDCHELELPEYTVDESRLRLLLRFETKVGSPAQTAEAQRSLSVEDQVKTEQPSEVLPEEPPLLEERNVEEVAVEFEDRREPDPSLPEEVSRQSESILQWERSADLIIITNRGTSEVFLDDGRVCMPTGSACQELLSRRILPQKSTEVLAPSGARIEFTERFDGQERSFVILEQPES